MQIRHVTKRHPAKDCGVGLNVAQREHVKAAIGLLVRPSAPAVTPPGRGLAACHCSKCHRTFTGITALDIHRSGGECIDPETVLTEKGEPRLVRVDKLRWSGWGKPGDDTRWFGGDE